MFTAPICGHKSKRILRGLCNNCYYRAYRMKAIGQYPPMKRGRPTNEERKRRLANAKDVA